MRSQLLAAMLGLTAAFGMSEATRAEASAPLAYGWCYAGSYHCYDSASAKAHYLRQRGYSTKIVTYGSNYAVYYHH